MTLGQIYIFCTSICLSVFLFLEDNLNKSKWIFTKLSVYIDIWDSWFGIVNGQFSSIFDRVIYLRYVLIFISGL